MAVTIHLPEALAGYSGGERDIRLAGDGTASVAALFDRLAAELPALERRIRDERGGIRRHVNVYVDGEDIRALSGADTAVPGSERARRHQRRLITPRPPGADQPPASAHCFRRRSSTSAAVPARAMAAS